MEQDITLFILREELASSRSKYEKLVKEVIKEHLYKKYIHAQIELYKIQKGMEMGKKYQVRYYGQDFKVTKVISVSEPPYEKIHKLNLSSMESFQPRMKVEVETDKGLAIKDVIYYSVKPYVDPKTCNPNEYKF